MEIAGKKVMSKSDKGYILEKDIKGQEDQFKLVTKFIVN